MFTFKSNVDNASVLFYVPPFMLWWQKYVKEGRKTSLKSKTIIKAKKGKLKEKEEAVGRC